jgi:AcrR family transcriptional regulator
MSTELLPKEPRSLRERHKRATAELILEAVTRCLTDVSLSDLSFARVAAEASVGERTVYRHFPTKEKLVDAWWTSHQKAIGQGPYPETAAALVAAPHTVFPRFDEQVEVMRGSVLSPEGRAISMRANEQRKLAFRRAVKDGVGDLPEPDFTRLCAAVQLLYSAGAWLTMREVWGLSGEESAQAVAEAIVVLLGDGRKRSRRIKKAQKSKAETQK